MDAAGVTGAVVNLGGNVVVTGAKPSGEPWRIAIRNPVDPATVLGVVPLQAGSAVTSGIYERAFTTPDGTLYHHILCPQTSMPVKTDLLSATVICTTSTDAEGFSTTLVALGREAALDFVRNRPEIIQAILIDDRGNISTARPPTALPEHLPTASDAHHTSP